MWYRHATETSIGEDSPIARRAAASPSARTRAGVRSKTAPMRTVLMLAAVLLIAACQQEKADVQLPPYARPVAWTEVVPVLYSLIFNIQRPRQIAEV